MKLGLPKVPAPAASKNSETVEYISPGWFRYHGTKYAHLLDSMPGCTKSYGTYKVPANVLPLFDEVLAIYAPEPTEYEIKEEIRLHSWQIRHREVFNRVGRYGFAWEMGLGKTIGALSCIRKKDRVLIICPSGVMGRWREDARVLGSKKLISFSAHGEDFASEYFGDIQLVTWSMLQKYVDTKRHVSRFDMVIVDEAHAAKKYDSTYAKAYQSLIKELDAPRILALTATPAPDDIEDWYGTCQIVNPWALGAFRAFQDRYYTTSLQIFGVREVRKFAGVQPHRLNEFAARIAATWGRETTDDHRDEMPEIDIEEMPVENPVPHLLTPGAAMWSAYAAACLDAKIPVLTDAVVGQIRQKRPTCVSVFLTESKNKLQEIWSKHPVIGPLLVCIDGDSMTQKKREKAIAGAKARIKDKREPIVLLVTTKSVLEGIELVEWQDIYVTQFSYYPMESVQFLGRFRRISRKDGRVVVRLVYEMGSFEESIILSVQQKILGNQEVAKSGAIEQTLLKAQDQPLVLGNKFSDSDFEL